MDLAALRFFRTVAEEGSITRAAQRLNTVQSNVTTRIRQLETTLATPLFDRINRRLIITPAGRLLADYADRLLALAEEAEQAVRGFDTPCGRLRLGSMETTAAARLPAILAAFRRRHADVALSLTTAPTRQLVEAVLQHRLDAVLAAAPLRHAELASEPLLDETLVLISAADLPASATVTLPTHFARHGEPPALLTFRDGCSYRQRLLDWVRDEGMPHGALSEFGTFEAIVGCVAAGMGISLLPLSVLGPHLSAGTIRAHRVPAHIEQATTLLVWHRARSRDPAREAFAAMARESTALPPR